MPYNFDFSDPMLHQLKTWPGEWEAVASRRKTHEVRRDDRGFAAGDLLMLREWNPASGTYTGRQLLRHVTYRTPGGAWGLPTEVCVLSIR